MKESLRQQIDRERLIALDEARDVIHRARYGERDLSPNEMAHEVFVARVMGWNANAIWRWKTLQLNRPYRKDAA